MAYLGAFRVTDLEVTLAPAGGWIAYLSLDSGDPPSPGAATITIGDLSIVGRVLPDRGGLNAPAHPRVVVAGGAGWDTPLPAPGGSYSAPNGVRLLTVLADLASIAGEAYNAPADVRLGPAYGWTASTAKRPAACATVLAELVSRGALPRWRADLATGRAVFTPWPSLGPADAHGRIVDRGLDLGWREVALDSAVAAWVPGATVQGVVIARTMFTETGGELRARVWES